jgi:putative flippase GtrA
MSAGGAASAAGPRTSSRLALLRYAAVGAVATLAHYALLWWLVEHVHWWPALAAGAGAALGAQLGFVGNRSFTFQHRGPWLPAWWRFQLTALLGGVTSMAVVAAGAGLLAERQNPQRPAQHYQIGASTTAAARRSRGKSGPAK